MWQLVGLCVSADGRLLRGVGPYSRHTTLTKFLKKSLSTKCNARNAKEGGSSITLPTCVRQVARY